MASLRPHLTTPKELFETLPSRHKIIIKHPAYDDHRLSNEMITLPAWDREEGGLHFGTVHLACAIIACNAFYGFLSKDRAGKDTSLIPTGF
jgi:hypothetical protein